MSGSAILTRETAGHCPAVFVGAQMLRPPWLSVGAKLPEDSFLFITVDAEPGKLLIKQSSEARKEALLERCGDFVGQRDLRAFEDDQFRFTVGEILLRIIRYSFNARPSGSFFPILKVVYKDTSWMATVGGIYSSPKKTQRFLREWRERMPFLPSNENDRFLELPRFNITEAERRLLDYWMTKKASKRRAVAKPLKTLGFDRKFTTDYQRFLRYIPRYFEAFN